MGRVLPLLLVAACGTAGGIAKPPDREPEVDRKYKEAAARGEVKIGMIRSEVRTAFGEPKRTSRTVFKRRAATCWSYELIDVYFDDEGYVIGWQTVSG